MRIRRLALAALALSAAGHALPSPAQEPSAPRAQAQEHSQLRPASTAQACEAPLVPHSDNDPDSVRFETWQANRRLSFGWPTSAVAVWATSDGVVVGYSMAEDSSIWSTGLCAQQEVAK